MSGPAARLFIGSSTEGLDIAYAVQESLDFDAEVTVWPQGIFKPNETTMCELEATANTFDFASFIFSPDDTLEIRAGRFSAVRDNVVFEFGLFCGALGRRRCSFLLPRHVKSLRLPTDLLGLVPLTYNADRSDRNLLAGVGAACNQLRRMFREMGLRRPQAPVDAKVQSGDARGRDLAFYEKLWTSNAVEDARSMVRSIPADPRDPDFEARRPALKTVYAFFESLSDAVLSGVVDEEGARRQFGEALTSFWSYIYTTWLPAGQIDPADAWDPLPQIGIVASRWSNRHV
ncbi:nucleotide-binding protein [Jiella endophytica]|uniref:nucleotide-binding protein n=1 Tax=Jiella endophytica TaxID=2558362 RepID=UPI00142FF649|nr:nucleotide-binding protein [Jiella endophytica]